MANQFQIPPDVERCLSTLTFYVRRGTRSLGAFSPGAIKSLLTDGILLPKDEVRAEGSTEWVSLARLIGNQVNESVND